MIRITLAFKHLFEFFNVEPHPKCILENLSKSEELVILSLKS